MATKRTVGLATAGIGMGLAFVGGILVGSDGSPEAPREPQHCGSQVTFELNDKSLSDGFVVETKVPNAKKGLAAETGYVAVRATLDNQDVVVHTSDALPTVTEAVRSVQKGNPNTSEAAPTDANHLQMVSATSDGGDKHFSGADIALLPANTSEITGILTDITGEAQSPIIGFTVVCAEQN